jgi:hypothetical protein
MSSSSRSDKDQMLDLTIETELSPETLAAALAVRTNSDEALIELVRQIDMVMGRWDFTIALNVALLGMIIQYAEEESDQEMAVLATGLRDALANT